MYGTAVCPADIYFFMQILPHDLTRSPSCFFSLSDAAHMAGSGGTGVSGTLGSAAGGSGGLGSIADGAVFSLLSPHLRICCGYHNFGKIFQTLPLFSGESADFLGRLALFLVPESHGAGEFIFAPGDVADAMCLLGSGRIMREEWMGGTITAFSILRAPRCFGVGGVMSIMPLEVRALSVFPRALLSRGTY